MWIEFEEDDEIFIITADGVDCSINEPRQIPSTSWYSQKFNGPGLTCELGIAINHNKLVWIHGPERSGNGNDLAIFTRPNGLKSKIPVEKKVVTDRMHKDPVCAIQNAQDTDEVKTFKQRARARHEIFNGHLKKFKVIGSKFRHAVKKHKECFEAVCVIAQHQLENGHPLFDV